jgi:glycerol-3-phosphate O-acyltransferase
VRLLRHQRVEFTAALQRNERDFLESLSFLEYSGLVRRLEGGEVIQVPAEKRASLDFYKNNTIHFFLVPALLVQVLRAGVRGDAIHDEVRWWLDLYRWEFPLPERGKLVADIQTLLAFLRSEGALAGADGETVNVDHVLVRSLAPVVDTFHEAYWVTAKTTARLAPEGAAEKAFRNAVRKGYETALMLGDARKPEGNSTDTISNALSRYSEMRLIELQPTGKGRERRVVRGPSFDDLGVLQERLRAAIATRETPTLN